MESNSCILDENQRESTICCFWMLLMYTPWRHCSPANHLVFISFQLLTFLVHRNGSTSGCTMLYPQKSSWNENHQNYPELMGPRQQKCQEISVRNGCRISCPILIRQHLCFHVSQTAHPAASWGYTKNTTKSPTYMVLIWSCEISWKGCSMNPGGLCGGHPLSVITPGN